MDGALVFVLVLYTILRSERCGGGSEGGGGGGEGGGNEQEEEEEKDGEEEERGPCLACGRLYDFFRARPPASAVAGQPGRAENGKRGLMTGAPQARSRPVASQSTADLRQPPFPACARGTPALRCPIGARRASSRLGPPPAAAYVRRERISSARRNVTLGRAGRDVSKDVLSK